MDTSNDIKKRYAKEVFTYRRDAWLVNIDAKRLFDVFKIIIRKLFNVQDEIKILDIKKLDELQLMEYVHETKKYINKEKKIDSYPFDKKI